jgi:hypothetical protein
VSFAGFADYNTVLTGSLTLHRHGVRVAVGPRSTTQRYAANFNSAGVTEDRADLWLQEPDRASRSAATAACPSTALRRRQEAPGGFLINADIHPLLLSDLSAFSAKLNKR